MAKSNLKVQDQKEQVRLLAESSLEAFIRLVHPHRVLGAIHVELINWMTREDAKSHQLILLPRDHGKSAMIAYRVAWEITRNPAVRILYLSSTSGLAIKQLKFIKDILTSDIYRFYWPEMVHKEEAKREKWTESEIAVDHPLRKAETIRDPTVFTGGLTTSITGLHFDVAVLDDVVVLENAYTEEGRERVKTQYSLLSSVESADSKEWVVGTRYHPKDLYQDLIETQYEIYDENGEIKEVENLYEVFERQVEDRGDGTGNFLWPRQQRYDGKWFGFDVNILAQKRAKYKDRVQFRAQYYNDPSDPDGGGISREYFQYYDRKHLSRMNGKWYMRGKRMNVFASVDFAYTMNKLRDYSCIVVVGVDEDHNYYILDIDRFQTDKIGDYFQRILALHQKWDFRKIRAEVTAAQQVIVNDLKMNYIRPYGLALSIDEFKPNRHQGNKEERIYATLQPKYQNYQMWHFLGGHCQTLEEELIRANPPHDDVKDALASAVAIAVPPSPSTSRSTNSDLVTHSRFGGIL